MEILIGKLEYGMKIETRPLGIGRQTLVGLQPLPSGRMGLRQPLCRPTPPTAAGSACSQGWPWPAQGWPQPGRAATGCRHGLQPAGCCAQSGRAAWRCRLGLQPGRAAQGAAVGCQPLRGWWLPTMAAAFMGGGATVQKSKNFNF